MLLYCKRALEIILILSRWVKYVFNIKSFANRFRERLIINPQRNFVACNRYCRYGVKTTVTRQQTINAQFTTKNNMIDLFV